MKDHEHRRDDSSPEHQSHVARQPDMDKTRSSASLQADILARLGYQQQSTTEPGDRAEPVPAWRKRMRDVHIRKGEDRQAHIERISSYLRGANRDADERVRMEVVRELERIATSDPGLVPPERFMRALGDEHRQVRATAVQAFTSLGASWLSSDLIAFLIKKLVGEKREDDLVRIAIMQLLATLGERSAVPVLVAQLKDEDWQVRETAVLALGSFINVLSDSQRETLAKQLHDENYFVREAVTIALKGH